MNELSKGINGDTVGKSYRDHAATRLDGAAHDDVQPGNARQNARAERASGFLFDGVRRRPRQSGLPDPC